MIDSPRPFGEQPRRDRPSLENLPPTSSAALALSTIPITHNESVQKHFISLDHVRDGDRRAAWFAVDGAATEARALPRDVPRDASETGDLPVPGGLFLHDVGNGTVRHTSTSAGAGFSRPFLTKSASPRRCRFRKEAFEERRRSAATPLQRFLDAASSSLAVFAIVMLGMLAATIACLPLLLLFKMQSVYMRTKDPRAFHEDLDASIRHLRCPPPAINPGTGSIAQRPLLGASGNHLFHQDPRHERQCVRPLLST